MKQTGTASNGRDSKTAVIQLPEFLLVNKSRPSKWLCGSSSVMSDLDKDISRVAQTNYSVLLNGESGSGKTTVARVTHNRSRRRTAKLVHINCAALPDSLVESELFGFERGAFTGAEKAKKGLFEIADKGTLFLDEIGDLKLEVQAKLLKAIDERKIRRLGGLKEIHCDVRLIAASSRDLQLMISLGTFREDLYYRLAVVEIDIPPLRERREDICELVYQRLEVEQAKSGRSDSFSIDEPALKELCSYTWPGNIRQLHNVIARLVCYSDGGAISLGDVRAQLNRFKDLHKHQPTV
jgi:transcriptional regulator with PAS, ATPase and Fis domain